MKQDETISADQFNEYWTSQAVKKLKCAFDAIFNQHIHFGSLKLRGFEFLIESNIWQINMTKGLKATSDRPVFFSGS